MGIVRVRLTSFGRGHHQCPESTTVCLLEQWTQGRPIAPVTGGAWRLDDDSTQHGLLALSLSVERG